MCTIVMQGAKDVLDLNYRKALKLEPDRFPCNFDLAELGVLGELTTFMTPEKGSICAELYKLNV